MPNQPLKNFNFNKSTYIDHPPYLSTNDVFKIRRRFSNTGDNRSLRPGADIGLGVGVRDRG